MPLLLNFTWIVQLLNDLHIYATSPSIIFYDNTAVIHIASNPIFHKHIKHIEVDCHFIQDQIIVKGVVKLLPIRTKHQLANIFTKTLYVSSFRTLLSKIWIMDIVKSS